MILKMLYLKDYKNTNRKVETMKTYSKRLIAFIMCLTLVVSGASSFDWVNGAVVNAGETRSLLSKDLVNYVTIDSSRQTLSSTQVVTVGVGNGELEPLDAFIKYVNTSTGEEYSASATNRTNDSFVFEFGFEGCAEGVYRLESIAYKLDGDIYTISFEEAGFDITWGVDVEVEDKSDAKVVSEDTSVVSSDNEMVYTVTTADATYTASGLSEAMNKAQSSISNSKKGRANNGDVVVVLDPGHGGSDSGACDNGLVEKDLTLRVASICSSILKENYSGIQVFMTRTDDSFVGLEDRINIARFWNADMFISIHFNSGGGNPSGAEVYYPNGNYNPGVCIAGSTIANIIENNLVALGLANRGIKIRNSANDTTYPDGSLADYYSVIRNGKYAGIPSIIVEHAFLQGDAELLHNDLFILALGMADANGVVQYYNLQPKREWKAAGIYQLNHSCENYTVGMIVTDKDRSLDYRWLAYDYSSGGWMLISDWKTNNEWMSWNPRKSGDFLIRGEVRETNNPYNGQNVNIGTHHNQYIKAICQMPNPNGYGVLMGVETEKASSNYRYEISVMDCSKVDTPYPWIYSTGRVQADKIIWAIAGIPYGYYITLFRIYDSNGNLLDQECYGYANV